MAMREEVKEQRTKLKDMTFKQKLSYFWDYYKIHTIVILFLLLVAGLFIRDTVNAKDYAFYAVLLNAYSSDMQEAMQEGFAEYSGIDTESYECFIDASSTLSDDIMSQMDFAVSQRIFAMAQTNGIDVLVSNPAPFENYAENGMFTDLRQELSAEEYEKYKDRFYYVDDVPVGIYLEGSARLKEYGCYTYEGAAEAPVFGFVFSSERKEISHLFLQYLQPE